MNHAVDYTAFRFEAVVDWVEVKVVLPRPSQFRHVREMLPPAWGRPHVRAHPHGETTDTFSFRVQDPAGPASILQGLQSLCLAGNPAIAEQQVSILAVEIAFDAHHVQHDEEALLDMATMLFYRQALHAPSRIGPRLCPAPEAGRAGPPRHIQDVRAHLARGWSIRGGEDRAEFEQRWYLKRTDTSPGHPHGQLPTHQHRARAEVTLRGAALPFATLSEWGAFRFETLRTPFFAWRVPLTPAAELGAHKTGRRLGLVAPADRSRRRRLPGLFRTFDRRTKTLPGTMPDNALHQCAKNALERLTRSQRKG